MRMSKAAYDKKARRGKCDDVMLSNFRGSSHRKTKASGNTKAAFVFQIYLQ